MCPEKDSARVVSEHRREVPPMPRFVVLSRYDYNESTRWFAEEELFLTLKHAEAHAYDVVNGALGTALEARVVEIAQQQGEGEA